VFNRRRSDFFIDRSSGRFSATEPVTIAGAVPNSPSAPRERTTEGVRAPDGTHGWEILIGGASAVT